MMLIGESWVAWLWFTDSGNDNKFKLYIMKKENVVRQLIREEIKNHLLEVSKGRKMNYFKSFTPRKMLDELGKATVPVIEAAEAAGYSSSDIEKYLKYVTTDKI